MTKDLLHNPLPVADPRRLCGVQILTYEVYAAVLRSSILHEGSHEAGSGRDLVTRAGERGIAIGPILFIIAMLGILAAAMSASSGGGFGVAGVADRVTADMVGQSNLIRNKISECYMQYLTTGTNNSSAPCLGDAYPCSDQTNGTPVVDLTCPNDPLTGGGAQQSIWIGLRLASLPPPTKGFAAWNYINAGETGGRCIWTAPLVSNPGPGVVQGLQNAAKKFSSQELHYDTNSASQKFVVMITPPSGTLDSHCAAP